MSHTTKSRRSDGAPPPARGADAERRERLHHEARQRHLAHTPEGTEPPPRIRRLSWTLFATATAVALVVMFVVLGATWGWTIAALGSVAVIGMYFIMFWPNYAAWALRAEDKRRADRRIDGDEPAPDAPASRA